MFTEILESGQKLHIGYLPEGMMSTGEPHTVMEVRGKIVSADWLSDKRIRVILQNSTVITSDNTDYFKSDLQITVDRQ